MSIIDDSRAITGTSLRQHLDFPQVRVVWVEICHDSNCGIVQGRHLVIYRREISLRTYEAIAISYVWGQVDRKKRPVGHLRGSKNQLQMELGKEWTLTEFIDALAGLCSGKMVPNNLFPEDLRPGEKRPIWIDQLCIPQDDEQELRKSLAKISHIFCEFPVAVLLPGSPCNCIREVAKELSALPDGADGAPEQQRMEECLDRRLGCLGLASSEWVRRLWPRQEFMFARRIGCVWTSDHERPCRKRDTSEDYIEEIPVLLKSMYDRYIAGGLSHERALNFLQHYSETFENTMRLDYIHHLVDKIGKVSSRYQEHFFQFMLGQKVLIGDMARKGKVPSHKFFAFRLVMEVGYTRKVHRPRREATRSRDYIFAIWAACPRYVPPQNFPSMNDANLMQDALDQLARNYNISFGVTAPRGLFNKTGSGSALWRPSEYLESMRPACDLDYYRSLATEALTCGVVDGEVVPVIVCAGRLPALSIGSREYGTILSDMLGLSQPLPVTLTQFLVESLDRINKEYSADIRDILTNSEDPPAPSTINRSFMLYLRIYRQVDFIRTTLGNPEHLPATIANSLADLDKLIERDCIEVGKATNGFSIAEPVLTLADLQQLTKPMEGSITAFKQFVMSLLGIVDDLPLSEVTAKLLGLFCRTVGNWRTDRTDAVGSHMFQIDKWHGKSSSSRHHGDKSHQPILHIKPREVHDYVKFIRTHKQDDNVEDAYHEQLEPQVRDHTIHSPYKAMYITVANALELELDYCEEKKVKLIFSPASSERQARAGFCRGDVDLSKLTHENTITVSMKAVDDEFGTLLFDAERVGSRIHDGHEVPAYRVFAVWVPTESTEQNEHNARACIETDWREGMAMLV